MNQTMKLGFIGLGNLGAPIAENLLERGRALYVFNRTSSRAQPLIAKGALECTTVKELASLCDIVFSIVSDDAALNHITHGNEGIAANLKAGGIHISMSTILPETAKSLFNIHKQYKNHYIAAPVMGRPEAAKARKLNFLVSGDKAAIEIIKSALEDAGSTGIWEFGNEVTAANIAKLCSNFLIISAIEAMAESINLAQKSGLDAKQLIGMLTQTLFAAPVYINYSKILLEKKFLPASFSLKLGLKDVNLVMQQSQDVDAEMALGKLLQRQLYQCIERGYGEYDWTAIAVAVEPQ